MKTDELTNTSITSMIDEIQRVNHSKTEYAINNSTSKTLDAVVALLEYMESEAIENLEDLQSVIQNYDAEHKTLAEKMKRSTPADVIVSGFPTYFTCPSCGKGFLKDTYAYCPRCGQYLRWTNPENSGIPMELTSEAAHQQEYHGDFI